MIRVYTLTGKLLKEFTDCYKALAYIKSLPFIVTYECDDSEDNEFLWRNIK